MPARKRDDVTVSEWVERYLDQSTVRPATMRSYRVCASHIDAVLGDIRLRDLTVQDIKRLWRKMAPDGIGRATTRNTATFLRSAITAAQEQGFVEGNPAERTAALPPAYEKTAARILTVEQVRKVIDTSADDRLAARWALALCGFTQGEVLGLTWSCINLKTKTLEVRASSSGAHGPTVVAIPRSVCPSTAGGSVLNASEEDQNSCRSKRRSEYEQSRCQTSS
jgi:integrase